MTSSTRNWCQRLGAAAIAVAAALALSGRAAASCGNYLVIEGAGLQSHVPGSHGQPMGYAGNGSHAPTQPCRGPECTRRSPAPMIPVTTSLPPRLGSDAWAETNAIGDGAEGLNRHAPPTDSGTPIRMPNLIFHPPRPAASETRRTD